MNPFLWLYFALLALWVPLLWPALRARGWARAWLLIVCAAGLVSALYEARMWLGTTASIRLDIPLISIALAVLYGSAAAVLFGASWRKAAAVLVLVLAAIVGVMAYEWISIGQESERLREVFHARNALLFEAKFRDRETYERHFGPFAGASGGLPTGHWEAQDDWQYSRLIINSDGQAWLFHRCDVDTECLRGATRSGLERIGAESEGTWQATLEPRMGAPTTARITRESSDRLSLETNGRKVEFSKTPPPLDPAPARRFLAYVGPLAIAECSGQHAHVRQLWLWREAERLYGVGIFATLVAGRRAKFVSPTVLGEGLYDGASWVFAWQRDGQAWSASVTLERVGGRLELARAGEPPKQIALDSKALFQDETISLAPLTSKADWDHWFEIVLTGHSFSGDIPAC